MTKMMNRWTGILGGIVGLTVLIASLTLAGSSLAGAQGGPAAPTPAGFDRYLVYMANGVFDPDEPELLTSETFHLEIMGRSQAEMDQQEALARQFYEQRFGLNLNDGSVEVSSGTFSPSNNYRAYTIAGEFVPAEGYVVRDGSFAAVVVAEGGVTLGGQYAVEHAGEDLHVPKGAAFAFGDYNIMVEGPGQSPDREIVLHFRSGDPLIVDQFGVLHFTCGLVNSENDLGVSEASWDGMAQGVMRAPETLPDGRVKVSVRNVLTFPPR